MRVTYVLRGLFLAIVVSAFAVGCGDDEKKKADQSEKSKAGDGDKAKAKAGAGSDRVAADESGAAPSAAMAATQPGAQGGGELLRYIPGDANAVLGMNLSGIKASPLFKMVGPSIAQKAGFDLEEFTAACGDPMTLLHGMVLGGNTEKEQGAVAFKVGLSKDKAKQCVTAIAEKKGEKISIEESGQLIALKKDGNTDWLAWLDGGIIVAIPDKGGDKAALEALIASKSSVTGNAQVMELVGKVDRSANFWGAFLAPADKPLDMIPGAAAAKATFGSVNLRKGLKLDAVLRFASAAEAKATATKINGMMGQFKAHPELGKFVAKVAVTAAGNDLVIKLDLNIAELVELLTKAQAQMPMIMQMMGN